MRKQEYNNHFDFEYQELSVSGIMAVYPRGHGGDKFYVRFYSIFQCKSDKDFVTTRDPADQIWHRIRDARSRNGYYIFVAYGDLRVKLFSERFH